MSCRHGKLDTCAVCEEITDLSATCTQVSQYAESLELRLKGIYTAFQDFKLARPGSMTAYIKAYNRLAESIEGTR